MPGGVLTELPDTGEEPDNVADLKRFKARLLQQGGRAASSEFKSLPVVRAETSRSLSAEIDPDEELSDEERENMELNTNFQPHSDQQFEMKASTKDPLTAIADYLEQTPAREDIKIVGEFGKLSFKATNVSINDYGVAFIIKKDSFQFEPNINTQLKVLYKSQEYNVIYAGGFFTFPKIPFTFVSFLRVTEDS